MASQNTQKKETGKLGRRMQDAQNNPRVIPTGENYTQTFTQMNGSECLMVNMSTGVQTGDISSHFAGKFHGLAIDVAHNTSVMSDVEHENPCYSVCVASQKLAMEYTENNIKHVMLPPVAELQRIFAPMKSGSIFVMALHSTDSYKKMHFGVFDDYKSLNNALRVLNRTDNQEQTQEYKSVNLWNHKTGPVSTNNISVNDKSPWHQVNNSSIKLRKNFAADTDDVIIYHEFTVDETKDIKNMLDMSHRPTGGSVNAYSSRSSVARSQSAFSRMLPASNKQRGQ